MQPDRQLRSERESGGVVTNGAEAGRAVALRAVCWGTRGSIPSPGPTTTRYGGNTSCLEVRAGERLLIFDAGTGIRALGQRLAAGPGPVEADLFLSHFHWDHIQGLPFFAPLYDARTRLRIHGAPQDGVDVRALLAGQMSGTYFPVPHDALAAEMEFCEMGEAPWVEDDVEVASIRVRHPGRTLGFRVRAAGASLAYIPDNELIGASYPVDPDGYAELVAFLDGVDLLIHDAMFTDAEYPTREGWGHSTFRQTVRLAEEAGAGRLVFFHHAPDRGDDELDAIHADLREELGHRGSELETLLAREGAELVVQERSR